jgi:DNA mismatch repair protein MutL
LSLNAGTLEDEREAGCPEGTTVIVRDLFRNTPARQKFLKRDATEAGHIQDAVLRGAMGRPDISFRLLKDGAEVFHTPGDGKLLSAVYSLFGGAFGQGLLEAGHQSGAIRVSGFVGKPSVTRGTRAMQYFFVLGRPVRSRTLYAALEEGFRNAIPAGRTPVCVLHLTLTPADFDVNVHPAKSEIKFARDREVFDAVYYAVRSALASQEAHADLRLPGGDVRQAQAFSGLRTELVAAEQLGMPENPIPREAERDTAVSRELASSPGLSAYIQGVPIARVVPQQAVPPASAPPDEVFPAREMIPPEPDTPPSPEETSARETAPWRLIGQALGGYLLVESADALWLIDKHAAHERVLFERLKAQSSEPMSQILIVPQTVTLTARLCAVLLREETLLRRAGFLLEDFGGPLLLRAAPDFLPPEEAPALLSEIAETLLSGGPLPALREEALRAVACKAAIKLTERGDPDDLLALTALVMETPDLRHCPHGRPVAIRLTRSQLERQFMR